MAYIIIICCVFPFYSDFHNLFLFTECPQKCAVMLWRGTSTRSPQLVNILYVSIILFLPLFTPLLQFSWRRGVNLITDTSCRYPTILANQKVIKFSHFYFKIFLSLEPVIWLDPVLEQAWTTSVVFLLTMCGLFLALSLTLVVLGLQNRAQARELRLLREGSELTPAG